MMDLREQIARAICGNWVVGDDRPWQGWLEEADAVLEVLAKQEPVAWFEKSPEFDAWFLAYSCNPKAETRPLYAAPGAQADLNLSCKSVQARLATQWGYVRKDDAQTEQIRNEIQRLRAAVLANHEWHQRTDDYGGYPESEICEINTAALAAEPKPGDANAAL